MTDMTRDKPAGALEARLRSEFMAVLAETCGKPLVDPFVRTPPALPRERPFDLVAADPDFAGFSLDGFDPTPEGGFMARCSGVPQGQRQGFEGYTYPERHLVVEAIARVLEVRSRRMDDDGGIPEPGRGWREALEARHPDWLRSAGFEHGDGWGDMQVAMFAWLDEAMDPEDKAAFRFDQIKEKFAGLRAYHGGPEIADDITGAMEEVSEALCERCGAPGHPRQGGWISTLCDAHAVRDRQPAAG
jgi:hypothetical protein